MQKAEATMEKPDSHSLGVKGNKASSINVTEVIHAPAYHGFGTLI